MIKTQTIYDKDKQPVAVIVDYRKFEALMEELKDRRDYEEGLAVLEGEAEWNDDSTAPRNPAHVHADGRASGG